LLSLQLKELVALRDVWRELGSDGKAHSVIDYVPFLLLMHLMHAKSVVKKKDVTAVSSPG
jgi:hypothetical protein